MKGLETEIGVPVHPRRQLDQNPAFLVRQAAENPACKVCGGLSLLGILGNPIHIHERIERRALRRGKAMNPGPLFNGQSQASPARPP